jgi:hypothetical protein
MGLEVTTLTTSHSIPIERLTVTGFGRLVASPYVFLCAAFSAIGGLLFGYDQGVVSVILVMPQFLGRFPRVSEQASGAGFWKGLLTAMIELGALMGMMEYLYVY